MTDRKEFLNKIWELAVIVLLNVLIVIAAGDERVLNFFANGVETYSSLGTQSAETRKIQQRLKQLGYFDGGEDGLFCPQTRKALRNFQRDNGLEADGIAGEKTLAALKIEGSAAGDFCCAETELLAKYIDIAAKGGDLLARVEAGSEIILCLENSGYPDTAASVIFMKISDKKTEKLLEKTEPTQQAKTAAKICMEGMKL